MLSPQPATDARDWAGVIALYASLPEHPYAVALGRLVVGRRDAGYVAAGLRGSTSMLDLALGPARHIGGNPHLDITQAGQHVRLTYDDGSFRPWSALVDHDDLGARVERFLVKRARWFRDARPRA